MWHCGWVHADAWRQLMEPTLSVLWGALAGAYKMANGLWGSMVSCRGSLGTVMDAGQADAMIVVLTSAVASKERVGHV